MGEKLNSGNARKYGMTLTEFLVLMLIFGVLVAILLPAISQVREAANQAITQNNLRQIAMGALNHEAAYIKAGQFSDAALLEFKNALPDCEVTLVQTDE